MANSGIEATKQLSKSLIMTIGEHLHRQVRTCNRIKWAGVLVLVMVAFQQVYLKHSSAVTYSWMAVAIAPWVVALIAFGTRVRCPQCQKGLFKDLAGNTPTALSVLRDAKREWIGNERLTLDACPQCGCRFSDPFVEG